MGPNHYSLKWYALRPPIFLPLLHRSGKIGEVTYEYIGSDLRPSVASWNFDRYTDFPAQPLLSLSLFFPFKTFTQMLAEHLKLGHGRFLSVSCQFITLHRSTL
jgi:hypothetical protein